MTDKIIEWYHRGFRELEKLVGIDYSSEYMNSFLKNDKNVIAIKEYGDQVKLNYRSHCTFKDTLHLACRGTILCLDNGRISNICTAPRKFFTSNNVGMGEFNVREGMSLTSFLKDAEDQGWKAKLVNKYDGSFIMIFSDKHGNLYSSTRGCLDPSNVIGSIADKTKGQHTFSNLSLEYLENYHTDIVAYLKANPYYVVVFELITPWNRVVTHYSYSNIVPLVISNNGVCFWNDLVKPQQEFSWDSSSDTWKNDMDEIFAQQESDQDKFGVTAEGLVLYITKTINDIEYAFPVSKLKRDIYLLHHRIASAPPVGSECDLKQCELLWVDREHYNLITENGYELRKPHLDELDKWLDNFVEIADRYKVMQVSRKDYAIDVNKNIDVLWRSYFFKLYDKSDIDVYEHVLDFLKFKNHSYLTRLQDYGKWHRLSVLTQSATQS